jgi:glycosyltransferase involved in cell wall biosynthesis
MQWSFTSSGSTLEQQARAHNNDYSALEGAYHQVTGAELVQDPYGSARYTAPGHTLSASVLIPAWNARDTLEQCLIAIGRSSFNRKYPQRLEVVVVDDGSSDGTWELLERLKPAVRLKAVRQAHQSRAVAQNTGLAVAEGDIVISCDADMILSPLSIEELMKRHELLDAVLLIGFRADSDPQDPRIQPAVLAEQLPRLLPPFAQDLRLDYSETPGAWPASPCRDTQHLKRMGMSKLPMADGGWWNLPRMVLGALFSLRRSDFIALGGYDERFRGWGWEDTLVGARAVAMGHYIVPVYSAGGLHIAHADRSPRKWQEYATNLQVYESILRAPFVPGGQLQLEAARARVRGHFEQAPAEERSWRSADDQDHLAPFEAELADAERRGAYLMALGRYDEAALAFAEVEGSAEQSARALIRRGQALRGGGRIDQALIQLQEAVGRLPDDPEALVELALACAALDQFTAARDRLRRVRSIAPDHPTIRFLLGRPAAKHIERAALFVQQGHYALGIKDYEAALILDPHNQIARVGRATAQAAQDRTHAAYGSG